MLRHLAFGRNGCRQFPGQQLLDPVDRMIGDAPHYARQIPFRVDPVQLRRANQAVDRRRPLAAGIGTGEQIVLASQRDRTQSTFGGVMPRSGLCRVGAD
jgi:hypothetical protein